MRNKSEKFILRFKEISRQDVSLVGGKNASLGEMFSRLGKKGISVPDGFALTSAAYWHYLKENNLDKKLRNLFVGLNTRNIKKLQEVGRKCRNLILNAKIPEDLKKEILNHYKELERKYGKNCDVATRSSATAEDLPGASFAGQHETFLNIRGEKDLLKAVKKCMASLFNDRAIVYREEKGFNHFDVALSVGVQKMIRSDLASSGVMFTMDTESGFRDLVVINSIYGVGEMIVKGRITPDEFYVFKPTLKQGYKSMITKNCGRKDKKYIYSKDGGLKEVGVSSGEQEILSLKEKEVLTLARWACAIEDHYKSPQDIEWAKDGITGKLYIVQSRPETVHAMQKKAVFEEYKLKTKKAKPIIKGIAIGNKIGMGRVRVITDISKISQFQKGEVLVAKMTDPDWVPVIRIASAIVTDEGSKVCHAAIVSRELGIPAIVGTMNGTKVLKSGQIVTVDCTSGLDGKVFLGKVPYTIKRYDLKKVPKLKTKIMINIGAPDIAFKTSFLPNSGVGLARIEFIFAEKIKVHPLALYHYHKIKDRSLKSKIDKITFGYKDKTQYFVDELAGGVSQIAAAFYPKPVIVRFSDFKTNEYKSLVGGEPFEPEESNPMLGWRGASRYYDEKFKSAFEMECRAIKRAREVFGLKNIWAMVPFCRTVEEGKKVLELMAKNGLKKGNDGLKVIVMCEIPSNVILAEEFLKIFDGMSIGSNDLTQLVLGLDRDSAQVSKIGDERNEAVKEMIKKVIELCNQKKKYCGICGQGPSDFPEFAKFLMKEGIESISLNPDTVIKTILTLAKIKK
ncbi:MAG TPA: phosphoenolpyruvate synthase [Candidatus Humimicrobiaceae bacterium]|nr:phosphoenolpyruvate synthase [Candidatus Humimicrobiaceae bacterium]